MWYRLLCDHPTFEIPSQVLYQPAAIENIPYPPPHDLAMYELKFQWLFNFRPQQCVMSKVSSSGRYSCLFCMQCRGAENLN